MLQLSITIMTKYELFLHTKMAYVTCIILLLLILLMLLLCKAFLILRRHNLINNIEGGMKGGMKGGMIEGMKGGVIGEKSNEEVLELMSTKRYNALCKLFKTNKLDYQTFKQLNNNYRNEVDTFIDYLKLQNISHHSAGSPFKEPTSDYYIEDDVVGLNNYLSCGKKPSLEEVLRVPLTVSNYKLVAYITKTYDVIFVDESSTPLINDDNHNDNYNATKKSYPRYLHAMYKRDNTIEKRRGEYIKPKIRVFPHYGSNCVFNAYTSLLALCGDDVTDKRFADVIRDVNSNTTSLEKDYGVDYHTPFNLMRIINEDTYDKTKWLITTKYINNLTNLDDIASNVREDGYELVGAMLVVSRIGPWNDFFHQIAYSMDGYVADDMTYLPYKITPKEIEPITLCVNALLLRRCK